MEVNKSARCVA